MVIVHVLKFRFLDKSKEGKGRVQGRGKALLTGHFFYFYFFGGSSFFIKKNNTNFIFSLFFLSFSLSFSLVNTLWVLLSLINHQSKI